MKRYTIISFFILFSFCLLSQNISTEPVLSGSCHSVFTFLRNTIQNDTIVIEQMKRNYIIPGDKTKVLEQSTGNIIQFFNSDAAKNTYCTHRKLLNKNSKVLLSNQH